MKTPFNKKKQFVLEVAGQSALMAACTVALIPTLALTPLTIALRNKREKLPQSQYDTHPIAKAHEALAMPLFFCVANIVQGPAMIAGSYHRAFKEDRFNFKDF